MSGSYRDVLLRLSVFIIGVAALTLGGAIVANADTYSYDALGRLIAVTYSDGSSITYTYDSAGNRTTLTQTAAP